jgi:hypothetical protein
LSSSLTSSEGEGAQGNGSSNPAAVSCGLFPGLRAIQFPPLVAVVIRLEGTFPGNSEILRLARFKARELNPKVR